MSTSPLSLTAPGHFVVGCNYWAAHAGTHMWRDWQPQVVAADFARIQAAGLQVLRVFPLWPDFQPIHQLRGGHGRPEEIRFGEEPLPDTAAGRAGVSAEMVARFGTLLDLAAKHDLKLIVGLVTGWMSGRLFVPPALEGLNPITDPTSILWQVRMIRYCVGAWKHHPAILGWDLGNECNCMGPANRAQAYTWSATIAATIRAADPTRPVVSGMHSLTPGGDWTMQDQGELTDLLCTHPYPVFTPHCDQDPVHSLRTTLHGTAESRYYADLGQQPCLCQEVGTLGPMIASEPVAADFIRTSLWSLWANDCHGLLWWCAHEQTHLSAAPYDWCAVERELGLWRVDGSPKPVVGELTRFRRFLDGLPFAALPPRQREAVCILTRDQDTWGVAHSTFILAKQAGFDLSFQYATEPIADAPLYLLPSLSGLHMISRRRLQELLAKVAAGATLYVSLNDGLPSQFEALTGLEPQSRERRRDAGPGVLDALDGRPSIPVGGAFKVRLQPTRAAVLGHEADGNPLFTVAAYGQGRVFFLNTPIELQLTWRAGSFHAPDAPPAWRVYHHVAASVLAARAVAKDDPCMALTEHPLPDGRRVLVAVNHRTTPVHAALALRSGWTLAQVLHGDLRATPAGLVAALPANDGLAAILRRA